MTRTMRVFFSDPVIEAFEEFREIIRRSAKWTR